jgi:hypothetical protein
MRETLKKDIDGEKFEFLMMPPKVALRILTRLIKIAGEPLGIALAFVTTGEGLDKEVDPSVVGKSARALIERLDEDEVMNTVIQLCDYALMNGKKITFDVDFTGRMGLMFKVIAGVLEANYADFFGDVGGLAGIVQAAKAQR